MPAFYQPPLPATPPRVVSGSGAYLTLSDGRRVLDADGGAAVNAIGHGNERVADAIARQARKLAFTWSGTFASEPAEELAELLLSDSPGGLTHAFFAGSGSEACEAAVKLARQYFVERGKPERTYVVARRQSFHGMTLGALSLSGHVARRKHFAPFLSDAFSHVSPCFAFHHRRDGETDEAYVGRLQAELEQEFERLGPNRVAAFCAETVVGGALGAVAAAPGYFRAIRETCDRYGVLLILDEVLCGMGRTGVRHAWMDEGITPDIQAIGKALSGGYVPISAALCTSEIADTLRRGSGMFVHGHTYQAHPLACAAAIEVQRIVAEQDLVANAKRTGDRLRRSLLDRIGNAPWLGEVRGRGLLVGIEFLRRPETKTPFDPDLRVAQRLKSSALAHGISLFTASGTIDGVVGDHALLAPPFNIREDEVAQIVDAVATAADETLSPLMAA